MKTNIFFMIFLSFGICNSNNLFASTNLKNKVIINVNEVLYDIGFKVTDNEIVIENDTIESKIDTLKVKFIVRSYLTKKKITKDSKSLETKIVNELIFKIIEKQKELISSKSKASTKSADTVSAKSKLNEIIDQLESEKGKNLVIASLKTQTITPYPIKKGMKVTINDKIPLIIKSVSLSTENGYIKDILVRTSKVDSVGKISNYNFSNLHYIPFRNAQDIDNLATKNRNLLTFQSSKVTTLAIDLKDVLDFHRTETTGSGTYVCNDTTLTFKSIKDSLKLNKTPLLNSLNLRIFSDPLGYEKNTPNGIIQIESQLNFVLNTLSTKKQAFAEDLEEIHFGGYRHEWVWLNRISPYTKWMKLNKDNTILSINPTEKGDLMNLFKYAYLDLGTELNILSYKTDSKLFTANVSTGLWRSKIGTNASDTSVFVSTLYLNPTLNFKFFESNRIDFNLGFGLYAAWQVSPITKDDLISLKTNLLSYSFVENNIWAQFQQSINFHPEGNIHNSIFLRTNQYIGAKNSHFTFQIGYSTSLSKIFK